MGTTSKALPSVGGFAVADQRIVDYLRYGTGNRPFIFAASAPAAAIAAVRAALEIVERDASLRRTLWASTRRLLHAHPFLEEVFRAPAQRQCTRQRRQRSRAPPSGAGSVGGGAG